MRGRGIGQPNHFARERGVERLPPTRARRRLSGRARADGRRRCAADDGDRAVEMVGVLEEREHRGIRTRVSRCRAGDELLLEIFDPERELRALRFQVVDAGFGGGEGAEGGLERHRSAR